MTLSCVGSLQTPRSPSALLPPSCSLKQGKDKNTLDRNTGKVKYSNYLSFFFFLKIQRFKFTVKEGRCYMGIRRDGLGPGGTDRNHIGVENAAGVGEPYAGI